VSEQPGKSGNGSASKKAQAHAKQLREAARRRRRNRIIAWTSAGVVVVAAAAVVVTIAVTNLSPKPSAATAQSAASDSNTITEVPATPAITAIGASSKAPWAAPADASARAAIAGLPMLDSEGSVEHIHSHLSVSIDGTMRPVPADLGIDLSKQQISPLHTHDTSGIIHVESPVKRTFTLGQLFTEWNVGLDASGIGAYSTASGETMTVFVDGAPVTGNPAAIELANHEDIAIVVTTPGQTAVAPAAFVWPQGY
jgi:hypothetical protein